MHTVTIGRLRLSAVVECAGPTRPTWLLPDAVPEAVERHRAWLAPHFLDDEDRGLPRRPEGPRARHLFARREREHWSAERNEDTQRVMTDSVTPV